MAKNVVGHIIARIEGAGLKRLTVNSACQRCFRSLNNWLFRISRGDPGFYRYM